MHDTLHLVSSDDVGRDEASVQSLLKKHKDVTDELKNYQSVIEALHEQAANLGEQVGVCRNTITLITCVASVFEWATLLIC